MLGTRPLQSNLEMTYDLLRNKLWIINKVRCWRPQSLHYTLNIHVFIFTLGMYYLIYSRSYKILLACTAQVRLHPSVNYFQVVELSCTIGTSSFFPVFLNLGDSHWALVNSVQQCSPDTGLDVSLFQHKPTLLSLPVRWRWNELTPRLASADSSR